MWTRKRIDISSSDLIRAVSYVFSWRSRKSANAVLESAFTAGGKRIACLTERSGFDLLLSAQANPPGGEVLISAVTIADMVHVIRRHDLIPVPVDVNPTDMSPQLDLLEAARTPRTCAVLVAHLYGGRFDIQPIIEWASCHGLQVWEDCAQAFAGNQFYGHPQSDVVLFSFGPIKTATALGGGLLVVRNPAVLELMSQQQERYPPQSRWEYFRRILKYAFIKAISMRLVFALAVRGCRLFGQDYDRVINGAVRNIPGDDLFAALRQKPSVPLLLLMARRLRSFSAHRLGRRAESGRQLAMLIQDRVCCPGVEAAHHDFWVFPICIPDGAEAVATLRDAGFDATTGSALHAIQPPADRLELAPTAAREIVASTLFVPVYPEMPAKELRRLGETILRLVADRAIEG